MSYSECYSCSGCGGRKCDKCSAQVCISNMESHRDLYKEKNEFNNKVYNAIQYLCNYCYIIKNNLYNNYGINIDISDCYDKLIQSDNFLQKMKIKNEEIQNCINIINNEMQTIKINRTNEVNNLKKIHDKKMEEINKLLEEEKKKFEINESIYEKDFKSKKQEINDLINSKKNIDIDIEDIVKSFIEEEKLKQDEEFNINKDKLDQEYNYIKKELKYTEKELKLKNDCLNEIKKINNYSDKIPNFENWIINFNLNKYLKS